MATTLKDVQVYEIHVQDADGRGYVGRITGKEIAHDEAAEATVYLTDDERVIVHDGKNGRHWEIEDPAEELREWLNDAAYCDAMGALGETPVIDL